ncbi:hypothetical protein PC118_g3005 [Phytophthora cactorum]|uniref:Uncharacterized protein n=1 Tax=Phytophthora cactorum TaxID=29920 RepID=A0A8T1GEU9_9STRA|nr:hypothetical protein PC118_g3005 [Phytophthora cactorum]
MHRAEKSSSKICRAREVEKAQELHRKKIDGVKSYVYGVISKPAASRSSTSFNLRPARSMMGSFSSITCVQGEPPLNASASTANSGSSAELGHQKNIQSGDSAGTSETWILDNNSSQHYQSSDEFQRSLAKMEEFRAVAPVPGLGSVAPAKPHSIKLVPPPAGPRKKSMNRSVRARHLKEIKHDNVEVFERIRKSVSHYSNDDLRREWQKNVSYLSSISEFPVSGDSLAIGHTCHNTGDGNRSCFGPSPRRSNFLRTTNCPEPLPSIPVIAHPIKCIPTSPKKLQLNMSPAFRSLRKAMPQQPSLPPISSAGGALDVSSNASNIMLLSPRDRSTCPNSPGVDDHFAESTSGRQAPYRSSTALAATKFIGDLHGKQAENEVSGDAKYQLLKTGRFVGGTYLVLTVFCGDGVTNPYGFEVFAYHRELQCEYKLSITKEMTHELLDKSSSSSLAAETAAAAGTNLSMQEIARNICDHINFALLGADQGEMVFLLPNVGRKSDQAMRFDASPGLVAFCLHQTVEIESDEVMSPSNSSSHLVGRKRKAHVFAATCPPKKYPGEVVTKANDEVVVFPALERPSPADGNSEQPEKQSDEGASPEEHEQELSPRTTRWEEENISEGDEDAGSDGYDVEGLDAASNADSLPYNTDEEEPAKTKASHISYTNQDDVDLNESLGDPKTHHPKDEETPENEATSDLRQWRQGRKIDGRFCLLQGASDDTTLSYSIAALGQLEALPTG